MSRFPVILSVVLTILAATAVVNAAPVEIEGSFSKYRVRWGDNLTASFRITNTTPQKQIFGIWGDFTYQGSSMYQFGPRKLQVPGYFQLTRSEPFSIPPLTPFGEYCLIVHVGPYPRKWDSAEDCFRVVLFANGEYGLEWENETFPAVFREMVERLVVIDTD